MPVMLPNATLALFPVLMVFAAMSDLFTMTISNRVSIILVAGFLMLAWLFGMPVQSIMIHLACGLGVLVLTFSMFAFGWIGGGDAKLAAATAVWMGADRLLEYGLDAAMIGGALTLLLLAVRKIPLPPFAAEIGWIARLHDPRVGVPYGIALACAGLLLYPHTAFWSAAVAV